MLFLTETPNKNSLYLLCTTDCTVFEVNAKISVSVPSDVIDRLKINQFYHNRFLLKVHSETKIRCDGITKNQPSNDWNSGMNAQIVFSIVLEKLTVEPGIAKIVGILTFI